MKDIREMTTEELRGLTEEELKVMINNTLSQFLEVFSSASKHISQLEEYRKEMSPEDSMFSDVNQMLNYAKPKLEESIVKAQDIVRDISEMEAKVLTPTTQSFEKGKSFVETMSQDARRHTETIQRARDERYEEMIKEAEEKYGPIESPMDRLKR